MKTKALILSALILAPTAGAAAAQSASAQDFRVQTGKALAAPAQDFRVSYAKTALNTTPTIFAKSNLPQALSDEELDEVTGEGLPATAAIGAAGNAGYEIGRQLIVNGGVTNWRAVGEAAVVGGVVGAGGGVIGAVGKGAQAVARPVAEAVKNVANTVSSFIIGTAAGTTHATTQKP